MTSAGAGSGTGIRLVCFDLGRVLVRICDDWRHACRLAGVVPQMRAGNANPRLLDALARRCDLGELNAGEFARAAAPLMGMTPEQVSAVSDAYVLGPYEGAAELLDELAQAGVATACLTNTNDNHWRILTDPAHPAAFPVHKLKHQFASHLLRARKPDPIVFERVEKEVGVSPESVLFFDDAPENVEAARAHGWQAFRVDPAQEPLPQVRAALRSYGVL